MIVRTFIFFFLIEIGQSSIAQIGVKIEQRANIYGTWYNDANASRMTLLLNQDGSGKIDGDEFSYSLEGNNLIITQTSKVVTYTYNLQSNLLQLSDGDLKGPVTFTRDTDVQKSMVIDTLFDTSKGRKIANIKEIKIGNQTWASENLNVSTFRNGDKISEVNTSDEWIGALNNRIPAYCFYNFDSGNEKKYGKLYNILAVIDPRGLAPFGWHIPNDLEWTILSNYLGGEKVAGKKMKSTIGWDEFKGKSGNGTNESGFAGLPGSFLQYDSDVNNKVKFEEKYLELGFIGKWWSNTMTSGGTRWTNQYAWVRTLGSINDKLMRSYYSLDGGFYIRCIKD